MNQAELTVILDDNALDFKYLGGPPVWTLSTFVQWYSNTSNFLNISQTMSGFGSFTLEFQGTSIAFIGITPPTSLPDSKSQFATISIDKGTAYNTTYGTQALSVSSSQAYVQWYQSPTLSDSNHIITISHFAGAVDMALITVGQNTFLQGKTLIVDNDNPAIEYFGTWTRNTHPFNSGVLQDGFPVGNTTHRSTNPGDMITFRFTGEIGTSVFVYGIFSWTQIGNLTATYTLDGTSTTETYLVTTSSPQFMKKFEEESNYILFSSDPLAAGNHTLVVNITQCVNQTFILDYITYTPSFLTLASMPNLTNLPTTTFQLGSSPATSSGSQVNQSNIGRKKIPISAIVGGVLGGILFFVLIGFLLGYLRRNRAHDARHANSGSRAMMRISPFEQDLGHSTSNDTRVSPFPNVRLAGYRSMVDIKRERLDTSNKHTAVSRFLSGARDTNVLPTGSRSISAPVDLLHSQDGVPPDYESLSIRQYSNVPSP